MRRRRIRRRPRRAVVRRACAPRRVRRYLSVGKSGLSRDALVASEASLVARLSERMEWTLQAAELSASVHGQVMWMVGTDGSSVALVDPGDVRPLYA